METPTDFTDFLEGLIFAYEFYKILHPKHLTDDEAAQLLVGSFATEFGKIPTEKLTELVVHNNSCIRKAAYHVLSSRYSE